MPESSYNRTTRQPRPAHAARHFATPAPQQPSGQRGHANPPRTTIETRGGRRNRPHRGRAALIALASVAGVAAIAYAGGVFAFSNVLYPNTVIAGVDVSLMSRDSAASRIESSATSYKLTLAGSDFSFEYKPEDTASLVDAPGRVDQVLQANTPLAWPQRLISALSATTASKKSQLALDAETDAQLPSTFDESAFDAQLSQAIDAYNKDRSGTFDTKSAYDESQAAFTLDKALSNVRIDKQRVTDVAKRALASLVTNVELDSSYFDDIVPGATTEQIQAAVDTANNMVNRTITLTMGGATVGSLTREQFSQWISFDGTTPKMDTEAMTSYLRQLTIDQLDTVGTERSYTRADGKQVTVSGGTYGWEVSSKELATKVSDALSKGQDATIEVPTTSAGATYTKRGERDWGAYVDVDLTEQHARYYDASGNLAWESGVITGNPNKGNDTPTGIYRMNSPARNITLVGKTDPATGQPIYRTPVDYWMPFVGGAIGFHDASWQKTANFSNPAAYQSVGSHGCVNLPPEKAAELYGLVKQGICVVVHW